MKAVGIFSTIGGGSVILDIDLPPASRRPSASGAATWSGALGAKTVVIVEGENTGVTDWHTSGPLLSIVIGGAWEIEASNGDRRLLELGSVLLVCDKTGQGHRSRTVGPSCTVVGVRLSEAGCTELKEHCGPDLPDTVVWPC